MEAGRYEGAGHLLVTPEAATKLGLENAEEGREIVLIEGEERRPAWAGYAWAGSRESGRLVLVVW